MIYTTYKGGCFTDDYSPVQVATVSDSLKRVPSISFPCPAWSNMFELGEIMYQLVEKRIESL